MKITKSLIETLASIELADDDLIDPDFAVKLCEQVGAILQNLDDLELKEINRTISVLIKETTDEDRVEFYEDFIENFGINS